MDRNTILTYDIKIYHRQFAASIAYLANAIKSGTILLGDSNAVKQKRQTDLACPLVVNVLLDSHALWRHGKVARLESVVSLIGLGDLSSMI